MTLAGYGHTARGNPYSLVALFWRRREGVMITPGLLPLPLVEQMREGENLAEHSQVPRDSKAPFDPVVPQIAEAPKLLT